MRYIDLIKFGGTENLIQSEMSTPSPGPDELLIRVVAAGVNRPDIIQRQGLYPAPKGASPILGLEVAGLVERVGENIKPEQWQPGDKVCALTNGGGYAEFVNVPAGQCLAMPEGLNYQQAAALPETFFTVWSNVFERAQLKAGEVLLVHGGASGIGTAAIQMAKCMGARVFTTASSDEKCQCCIALGCEQAFNYQEQDFVSAIKEATNDHGADVILDIVGGEYINRNIKAAAIDGRIVNIAFLQGSKAEVNFMPVMLKRLSLSGSTLRAQSSEVKAAIATQLQQHIWPFLENGSIKPVIAEVFPMHKVKLAHQLMESNQHIGKIVLSMDDSYL
ncbi:NAD(P)H-quinone oxidoreductase [Dasania marina]|uniref:NAD(P)H-quinone oxidoreductase n=1 Tax=Dasania marina TaxID=471499 RepID=UPI00036A049C|nr:NAD(P)H-quinone oxidoreductase [Dasania marina]